MTEDEARARIYKAGFAMNGLIAVSVAAITITGVLVLHDWTGLWSLVLMLFAVVPKNDEKKDDE